MSMGLSHFNTAPTALTHRLEIVVLLDTVCSTGQGQDPGFPYLGPELSSHEWCCEDL